MHYVVDAMNVIGTRPDGWWRDRDAAMGRLVDRLERHVAVSGDDVTVVFERRPRGDLRSSLVALRWATKRSPDAADFEIARFVEAHGAAATLVVVTSDRWLGDRVSAAGAAVIGAATFRDRIDP